MITVDVCHEQVNNVSLLEEKHAYILNSFAFPKGALCDNTKTPSFLCNDLRPQSLPDSSRKTKSDNGKKGLHT